MTSGAIDCHAHIFSEPVAAGTANAPRPDQMVDEMQFLATLRAHDVAHALLVQPSAYGTDNRAMLRAIDSGGGAFKGIAVLDGAAGIDDLVALKERGVVGLRFIVAFDHELLKRGEVKRLLAHLNELDMFAEVMVSARDLEHALPTLAEIPVKVVFDHLGWPNVKADTGDPGFRRFLELGGNERYAVKISNLVRISREAYPYDDITPFLAAILEAFTPSRCVWGSDSPFIHVEQSAMDYGRSLEAFSHLVPDAAVREQILVASPRRLFGFA